MTMRMACCLISVLLGAAWGQTAADLIIESRPQGKNNSQYKEIEGKWIDSQTPANRAKSSAEGCSDPATCGSRKFLFAGETAASPPPASARFTPMFAKPGHYYVYATWPSGANATPVTFLIKHAKGTAKVDVMQDGYGASSRGSNANVWISLGDYDFQAGAEQYVEMRAEPGIQRIGSHYGQVYSDAVRFSSEPVAGAIAAEVPDAAPVARASGPTPTPAAQATPAQSAWPASNTGSDSGGLHWFEDLSQGFQEAQRARRNILLFFYTPNSSSSRDLEQLFLQPTVKSVLSQRYVLIRINFLQNTDVGYKLRVFKGGTINLYDSSGNGLAQITDEITASELAAKLMSF